MHFELRLASPDALLALGIEQYGAVARIVGNAVTIAGVVSLQGIKYDECKSICGCEEDLDLEYLRGMEEEIIPTANSSLLPQWNTLPELIILVKEWLKTNIQGKQGIINIDQNIDIEINNTSIGKMFSAKIGETKLLAYTAIEEIIIHAKLSKVEEDKRNREHFKAILYFDSKVKVNGSLYYFGFNVRHTTEGKFLYNTVLPVK